MLPLIIQLFVLIQIFPINIAVNNNYKKNLCDNKLCNYEGICIYDNNNKTFCECSEEMYKGSNCTEFINYCIENPCRNDGACV